MKLYVVVGRIGGMVGFVNDLPAGIHATVPSLYTMSEGGWVIKAFKDVTDATDMHEGMIHSQAKLCKVVEIEIPGE